MSWQWVAIILGLALNFTIIFVATIFKGSYYNDEQQSPGYWRGIASSEKRLSRDETS